MTNNTQSKLAGKVALVTGASKGIGAAIAKDLAAAGARVAVNYASSPQGAEKVVTEITTAGGTALALHGDVSKPEDNVRLVEETVKAFGRLDILVNNAAVFEFKPLEEVTVEHFRRHFDINVLGLLLLTKAALPHLEAAKGGVVINVSSEISFAPAPGGAVYSATKAAVDAITRSLSKELGPRGIRVNSLNPGMVDTEGFRSAGLENSEFRKAVEAATPLGRIGRPSDIGPVAVFLASDDAAWISGKALVVDGGHY